MLRTILRISQKKSFIRVWKNQATWNMHNHVWSSAHCLLTTVRRTYQMKIKVASTGNWTHNTSHLWIRILTALITQPHRHLLNRKSLNWTWIISGSIEHNFIRIWKSETGRDWQFGWVGKAVRIVIHRWVPFPKEATLFCDDFETPRCQFLYKNARNIRFVLFRKNLNVKSQDQLSRSACNVFITYNIVMLPSNI